LEEKNIMGFGRGFGRRFKRGCGRILERVSGEQQRNPEDTIT
jgi:hypothetical protein